jgi:hypothetical protein
MPLFVLVLIIVAIDVLLLILLFILLFRVLIPGPGPATNLATPPPIDCDVTAELDALARAPSLVERYVLGPATDTDGTVVARNIELSSGTPLTLTGDLTLIAADDIRIDDIITIPLSSVAGPNRPIRVTLVSRSGEVRIGPGGAILGGRPSQTAAVTGSGRHAIAAGKPGESGALIELRGVVVVVEGRIAGNDGGSAGDAIATAAPVLRTGRSARAAGAQGGHGGSILICGEEDITVTGTIVAGQGGIGGLALSASSGGGVSSASGGPGGPGGDVVFQGTGAGACPVTLRAVTLVGLRNALAGGRGGVGGDADAANTFGGYSPIGGTGGMADATGGQGGPGGTVRCLNCAVTPPVTFPLSVEAGRGRSGGSATARGGDGSFGLTFGGADGGAGRGTGGDGGPGGSPPIIPVRGGGVAIGAAGLPGPGGDAVAQGGTGGNSGPFGSGGFSGTSLARGGKNGVGAAPTPAQQFSGQVAPTGRTGATARRVIQLGAP